MLHPLHPRQAILDMPLILRGAAQCGDPEFDADRIKADLCGNRMQAWATPFGYIVTELHKVNDRDIFRVSYASGQIGRNFVKVARTLVGHLEQVARTGKWNDMQGKPSDEILIIGRPGWEKVLQDYSVFPKPDGRIELRKVF